MNMPKYGHGWKTIMVACAAIAAASASAADVTGNIQLANGSGAKNAVVWLSGAEKSKPMKNAMVDQRDMRFIPHVSVVTVGSTVRFPNDDTVYHNVFAEFDAKKFDLGMYPRGSTKTIKFDKPGMVALFCSVHSEMGAYIMVVDTPYYAVTDGAGHFRIKDVTPGDYVVHVWHESGQTTKKNVTIGDKDPGLSLRTTRG
jgi:plastocyanin